MSRKIYLSPERRPAPHGRYFGYDIYERDYCVDIAARMKPLLESRGFAVRIADVQKTIYERAPEAVAWGADYYMPIHTNASTNGESEGKAQGALVLTASDAESKRASALVFARLNALRASPRGVQEMPGFFELRRGTPPVVYPELAFHDNAEDARFLAENRQALALALVSGICDYYGVAAPKAPAAEPPAADTALLPLLQNAIDALQKVVDVLVQ